MKTHGRVRLACAASALASSLLTTACGGSDSGADNPGTTGGSAGAGGADGTSAGGNSDGTSQAGAGAGGSSGAGGASGGGAGTAGAAGASKGWSGFVRLNEETLAGKSSYLASAGFDKGPQVIAPPSCTMTTAGACDVYACPAATDGSGGGPPATSLPSAGMLTVAGGADNLSFPYKDGRYYPVQGDKLLFQGGETLTFAASGGDVPAFSTTVTAPMPLELTSASTPANGPWSIDASTDLTLTWDAVTGGAQPSNGSLVEATIGSNSGAGASVLAYCTFDATKKTGTVPSAGVLVPIKALGNGGIYNVKTARVGSVKAGDYAISLPVEHEIELGVINFK